MVQDTVEPEAFGKQLSAKQVKLRSLALSENRGKWEGWKFSL